ncbi:unnamed protein product [Amoebophrya sp. A25]|nr:unnamed protein product [Amoebophrya sp. A25]|eukprot:GSA25T00005580001.1
MTELALLKAFVAAQCQLGLVCLVACVGNNWPQSYPRNENTSPRMFWASTCVCLILGAGTFTKRRGLSGGSKSAIRAILPLCREQTEEWKGWMQWIFIFYHYYRARYIYNEVRVFVSSYVWMTGFGNFLYFDKKADFSVIRVVSMLIRINWLPLWLCCALGTSLELYYVVPLHTAGFLITYATCYLQQRVAKSVAEGAGTQGIARAFGVLVSFALHYVFFECGFVQRFFFWSHELEWRFTADRYTALQGIASAMLLKPVTQLIQRLEDIDRKGLRLFAQCCLQLTGLALVLFWYFVWGHTDDKLAYNAMHPYILIFPLVGYVLMRNSLSFLTERYSVIMEFLGRNTLETYVLQFHVFMCRDVKHILALVPGAESSQSGELMKGLNMFACGSIFLTLAVAARRATVVTQECVVQLLGSLSDSRATSPLNVSDQQERHRASAKAPATEGEKGQAVGARSGVRAIAGCLLFRWGLLLLLAVSGRLVPFFAFVKGLKADRVRAIKVL